MKTEYITWILVAVMALIFQFFLPWWSIAMAGFIYGFFFIRKPGKAFPGGFLGIFLLWGIMASYITIVNDGVLAARLAALFSLPNGWLSLLATALTGGLTGGISATTGNLLRNLMVAKKKKIMDGL